MVIKTQKGMYEVIKNIRDAYDEENFNIAYLEEYFDSYGYIVGDIASETLRLKGFSTDPNNPNYFKKIPDYLTESCAYKGAYYILRRIGESEYNTLYEKYKKNPNKDVTVGDDKVQPLEKVPFDKDSLSLESTPHKDPNIILDMNKINKVKTFPLPDDLRDEADEMKQKDMRSFNNQRNNNFNKQKNNNNNNQQKNNQNNQPQQKNNNNNNANNNNQNFKKFSNMNGNKKAFSNNKK